MSICHLQCARLWVPGGQSKYRFEGWMPGEVWSLSVKGKPRAFHSVRSKHLDLMTWQGCPFSLPSCGNGQSVCSLGFPSGASGKGSTCQCRRHKRCVFYPWVGSSVFSNTTFKKHQFFCTQLSLWPNCHIHTLLLEKPWLWLVGPLLAK